MKIIRLVTALLLVSGGSARASLRAFPVSLPFTQSNDAPGGSGGHPLGIATNGSGYLVVWTQPVNGGTQVYGARVDAQGKLVGPAGFAISPLGGSEAAVAFDGTNYLVTWGGADGIHGSRVTTQGVVLDPAGLPIRLPQNQAGTIHDSSTGKTHVAFNGQSYLATWWGTRTGDTGTPPLTGIWAARVTVNGAVLDDPPIQVYAVPGNYHGSPWPTFSVASDPSGFLVVYNIVMSSGLSFGSAKVATNGTLTSGLGGSPQDDQWTAPPGVVFDGTRYHLVYGFAPHVGWPPAARLWDLVSGAATANDLFAAQYQSATGPAAAWDGHALLAAWIGTGNGVEAARITPNGTALDPASIFVTTSTVTGLAAASNRTSFLVVWVGGGAIVVDDTTAPTVFVPGTVTVKTAKLTGTTVFFTTSAYDAVAGTLKPTCTPAAGSLFRLGTTHVTCRATDWAGNVGIAGFDVVVKLSWLLP